MKQRLKKKKKKGTYPVEYRGHEQDVLTKSQGES